MVAIPKALRRFGSIFSGASSPAFILKDDGSYTLSPREALNTSLFTAAMQYMRLQFSEPPLKIVTQDGSNLRGDQRIASEYVLQQLEYPNFMMGDEIHTTVGVQALAQGNGYYYLDNFDRYGFPGTMWPVSFWRVKLRIRNGRPEYLIDNKPVPLRNIIHIRNGLDEKTLLGDGPLNHLLTELFADRRAFLYIAWLMKNRAMPSYAVSPKDKNTEMDKQDIENTVNKIADETTDENTGQIIGLDHNVEITALGFDPRQLRMADLTKITAERFCAATRIPPPILYVASNVPADNRSTLGHYRRLAAEDLFKPWWGNFAKQMTRMYLRRFISDTNVVFEFDMSKVSALQEDDSIVTDRLSKAWRDSVIHINQYLNGIGIEEIPDGDRIYWRGQFGGTPQEQLDEAAEERERRREQEDSNSTNDGSGGDDSSVDNSES